MNKIFFYLLTIFILSMGNVMAQINLSPRSAATAQTFGTFSRGLDAVSWNPAMLAYKYRTFQKMDVQVITEVDTVYRIHILTTKSEEQSDSIANNIKEALYKDSLFVNLQSVKGDSTFNIIIDEIINHTTAELYLRLMNDQGYSNTRIDTMNRFDKPIKRFEDFKFEREKSFHLELMNMGAMLSNSSVDANWINTYILNGGDIGQLDENQKNELLSVFPDDGWGLNPLINYKIGLRIKNVALQMYPDIFSEFVIPSGLFDLIFWGNEISKPIDFSGRKNQFQVVLPMSLSFGRQINIPFLNNLIDRSYFGVSAKYLAGLAYFESAFDTLSITPNPDYHSIQADIITKYSLAGAYMEVDPEKSFNYSFNTDGANKIPPGSGYAVDLGLIMNINDKLSSSIAITNLLGKISWGDGTAYEHRLKLNSQIPIDELQENPDSSLYSGIEIDTNITISSFQTNYPGALILGTEYSLKKFKLASNLKLGFSNELGSSTEPRFSLGAELRPLKWLSLLGGTSVGGYEGFQWGSGISIRLLFLHFSCAYSEYGGMLDSAKGFSVSASTALVF